MKKSSSPVKKMKEQALVIYKDSRGNVELRADIQRETVWATQAQIVKLFNIDQSVVSRHIRNIFKDGEVEEKSNMQKMHNALSDKSIVLYSLDIILAVGYRTNSPRAINFRQWATKTLREYLLKGYVLNEKRLRESTETGVKELQKTLRFIQTTIEHRQLGQSEVDSILSVITGYTNSWLLLHQYDEGRLTPQKSSLKSGKKLEYGMIRSAVDELGKNLRERGEAGELFGHERDGSFQGVLSTIYQTFDGRELYSSLDEKAAHLLYLIIKDHPFSDGNKRIGSFLFILFLERNKFLYRKSGEKKINDNALVALALLIAQSNPKDKAQMIALITQLLK